MAQQWKTVTGNSDKPTSYWPGKADDRVVGMEVIGTYKGSRVIPRPDGTSDTIFLLDSKEGLVGVNSHFTIADGLKNVPEGKLVRITFTGKKQNQKTGRSYNTYQVDVAASDEGDAESPEPETAEVPFA